MQQVLAGLKTENCSEFTSAYIDDIPVFSSTLEEHIQHLELVVSRLLKFGLKLRQPKWITAIVEPPEKKQLDDRDNGTEVEDSTLSSANAGDLPVVSDKAPRVPTQSSSYTRTRMRVVSSPDRYQ